MWIARSARVIVALLALSVFNTEAQAQSGDNMWGIKAAFDLNLPSKWGNRLEGAAPLDMYRSGFGGTLGAIYSYGFGSSFFLEPGVSLFYDTYSFKDLTVMGDGKYPREEDPSIYKSGVRIPVMVGYSYWLLDALPMRVYTGPELSYAFAGDVRWKNKALVEGGDLGDLFGKHGHQKRMDLAWKIGVGFETEIMTIGVEAAIGITDILKDRLTCRDNRVSITATHYF